MSAYADFSFRCAIALFLLPLLLALSLLLLPLMLQRALLRYFTLLPRFIPRRCRCRAMPLRLPPPFYAPHYFRHYAAYAVDAAAAAMPLFAVATSHAITIDAYYYYDAVAAAADASAMPPFTPYALLPADIFERFRRCFRHCFYFSLPAPFR